LVGISGISGQLVRPNWQENPPPQPDIKTNWISFGVNVSAPDANAYTNYNADGSFTSQRHETLEIGTDCFGPDAMYISGLIRDGFQIKTNLDALQLAKMGFVETGPARQIPDLVNERFVGRVNMSIFLRREVIRVYPVPNIISASGTIYAPDLDVNFNLEWETEL